MNKRGRLFQGAWLEMPGLLSHRPRRLLGWWYERTAEGRAFGITERAFAQPYAVHCMQPMEELRCRTRGCTAHGKAVERCITVAMVPK